MDIIDTTDCPTPRPRAVKPYAPGSANDIFSHLGPEDTLEALSNFRGPDSVYEEPDPVAERKSRRAKRAAARAASAHDKKIKTKIKIPSSRQHNNKYHPQRTPCYFIPGLPAASENYQIYYPTSHYLRPRPITVIEYDYDINADSESAKSEFDVLLENIQSVSNSIDETYEKHRKIVEAGTPAINVPSVVENSNENLKSKQDKMSEERAKRASSRASSRASLITTDPISSKPKASPSSMTSSEVDNIPIMSQAQTAKKLALTQSQENLKAAAAKAKEEHVNTIVKRLVSHVDTDPGLFPLISMLGLRSSAEPPIPPPHAEGTVSQSSLPIQQRMSIWKDEARMTWRDTGTLPDNYELLERIDEVLELYKDLDEAPTINIDDNAIRHLERLADFYEEQAELGDPLSAEQDKKGKAKIEFPPARTESNRIAEAYDRNIDFKACTLKRASDFFRILQAPQTPALINHSKLHKSSHGQIMEDVLESESEESANDLETPKSPQFGFDNTCDNVSSVQDQDDSVLSQLLEEYGIVNSKEEDQGRKPVVHNNSDADEDAPYNMLGSKKPLSTIPDAMPLPEQEYCSKSSLVTRTWAVLRRLTIPGLEPHEINDLDDMSEVELIADNYLAIEQDVFQWSWLHLNGPKSKNWRELPAKTRGMFERISPEVIIDPEASYVRGVPNRIMMMVQMLGHLFCEIHEDNYLFGLNDDEDLYMRNIATEMLRNGKELPYKIWDIGFVGKTIVKDSYIESFARKVGLLALRVDQYINPFYPPTEDNMFPKRRLGTLRDIIMRHCLFHNELRKHQAIYEFDFLIGQETWKKGWMKDVEESDFLEREIDLNGENWEQEALKYKVVAVAWPAMTYREPDSEERRVLVPAKVLLEKKRVNKHERMRAAGLPTLEDPPISVKPTKRASN